MGCWGLEQLAFELWPTFIDGAPSVLFGRADLFTIFGVMFDEANLHFSLVIPPPPDDEPEGS